MSGKPGRGGQKGRSGRKPKPLEDSQLAYKYIEDNIFELTKIQVDTALHTHDLPTISKLQDRLWGIPKVKVESETTIKHSSADQLQAILDKLMSKLSVQQQQFVDAHYGGPYALQITGGTTRESEEVPGEAEG